MSPFVVTFIFAAAFCSLAQADKIFGRPDCSKQECRPLECKETQRLYQSPYQCCAECLDTVEDGSVCKGDINCREGSRCMLDCKYDPKCYYYPGKPRPGACPDLKPCLKQCKKP